MKLLKEKLILEEPVDEINLGWVVVFRDMNDDSIVDGKKFETRSEAYEYMRQIQKEGVLKENPNLYIEIEEVDPAGSWAESLKEAKEDEVTIPEAELEQPIQVNDIPQDVVDNAYGNLISNSISREWDDINSYKDLVAQFVSDNQFPEVVDILNQLIDDKTINVGMLTKALELINGTEQNDLMQQGIDKAEEVISDERDLAKESIKEDLEHPAFPQVYDDETILDILGIEREVTDKERIKGHLKDRKELVRQFRKLVEKGYGEPQYEIYLKDDTPYYKDLGKVVDNSKDLVVIDTHQKVAEESLKEDIEEDKKKLNESTSIPDFANMLFDTIMNSPYEHLDDNKFEDELERPNEVDANKGIIRFNYDGKYFELTINEITDFDESYDAFDDDNEYIYQFPKDANLKYIQQNIELSPCNIKVIGRVNKKGDNPGDILLQGTKVDLEKFLDDYFDYEINDDYLYELDEFDTELISPISKKELKFEESKLTEGRYNDIQKQISETEKEIKELKDKLKETTDDEEIDKILEDIYNKKVEIGEMEGSLAEIRYIDNGSADDYSGYESLEESEDPRVKELKRIIKKLEGTDLTDAQRDSLEEQRDILKDKLDKSGIKYNLEEGLNGTIDLYTLPEEYQKQLEQSMFDNGWMLDDETTRYGSKNFYKPLWRDPDDEAQDIHYQFITKDKLSEEQWEDLMDLTYDLLDELEEEFNSRITFSSGLINDGSEYDERGTIGIDCRAVEYKKGETDTKPLPLPGQKVRLKNGKPADDASRKVIKDIEDHGIDTSMMGVKKDESLKETRDYESEYNITPADKKKIIQWWKDMATFYEDSHSKNYVSGIDDIYDTNDVDDIDGWLVSMYDSLVDLSNYIKNPDDYTNLIDIVERARNLLRRGKFIYNKYINPGFNYYIKENKK